MIDGYGQRDILHLGMEIEAVAHKVKRRSILAQCHRACRRVFEHTVETSLRGTGKRFLSVLRNVGVSNGEDGVPEVLAMAAVIPAFSSRKCTFNFISCSSNRISNVRNRLITPVESQEPLIRCLCVLF